MPRKGHVASLDELMRYASEDVRRKNAEIFGNAPLEKPVPVETPFSFSTHRPMEAIEDDDKRKPRLLTLNKTERRFYDSFLATQDGIDFKAIIQPSRFFELEKSGTYTPDFLVFTPGKPVAVIEIKGGYKGPGAEQGYERYYRAAQQYDGKFFEFLMYTWVAKERQWHVNAYRQRKE